MPDGPNIERLFLETDCLTANSNLKEICQYLRFFKNEDSYQKHLRKYLPKLADPLYKDAFDEFIGDLEDKELAKELKTRFKAPKEDIVPTVTLDEVKAIVENVEKEEKPKKKPGRPSKKNS